MKVSLNRKELLKIATILKSRTIKNRWGNQVIQSARIRAEQDGKVSVYWTEYGISAEYTLQGSVETPGVACVNVADFQTLLSSIETDDVFLELESETNLIGEKFIRFLKVNTLKMRTLDSVHWEDLESTDYNALFFMDANELKDVVSSILPAAQTNESRRNLMGIHITQKQDQARFTATDGHRLARWYAEVKSLERSEEWPDGVVIHRDVWELIHKSNGLLTGRVRFGVTDTRFSISCDGVKVNGSINEGRFPNCDFASGLETSLQNYQRTGFKARETDVLGKFSGVEFCDYRGRAC